MFEQLDKCLATAKAGGISYGCYMAMAKRPVRVTLPVHLEFAPTIFERLKGAIPANPPTYGHIQQAAMEPKAMEDSGEADAQ